MEKLCDIGTTSQELEKASLTEAFQPSPCKAMVSRAEGTPLRWPGNYLGTRQSVSPSTIHRAGEIRNEQRLHKSSCCHPSYTRSHAVTTWALLTRILTSRRNRSLVRLSYLQPIWMGIGMDWNGKTNTPWGVHPCVCLTRKVPRNESLFAILNFAAQPRLALKQGTCPGAPASLPLGLILPLWKIFAKVIL